MRVGILTFPHTTNYGATLQGFALRRAIASLGHDAGLFDYRHPRAMRVYNGLSRSRHFARIFWRKRRFVAFERAGMGFLSPSASDSSGLAVSARGLDAVVVGSDQVWDRTSFRGWRPEMYLDFVGDGCRRIAYAPSCGMTGDGGEHSGFLSRTLGAFDHLSARDRNTADFVRSLTGREATLVLDPTFLCDFGDVTPAGRAVREPYLLVYAQLPGPCAALAREIAGRLSLKIVSVGYAFAGADRVFIEAGPAEFLRLYRDASYVVTSFFHGTIFAVLNRLPFVSFLKADKAIKVTDLLDRIGLSDRHLPTGGEPTGPVERLLEIDYSPSEMLITEEIARSRSYLEGSLRGD